jgi:hypothetical protein
LKKLSITSLAIVLAGGFTGGFTRAAMAQSTLRVIEADGDVVELPTLLDEFEDTYFTQDKNYYQNHRFPRTLIPIFGTIELDIGGDGRRVHRLYREALEQQINSTQIIRVADLPSPFTGTLATTPLYTEEPLPPAPVPSYTPYRRSEPPAPSQPAASPDDSVPALW